MPNIPHVSLRLDRTCALGEDVSRCRYVSGSRAQALSRKKINSIEQLFLHIPKRYIDFSHVQTIESSKIGSICTIVATIDRVVHKHPRPKLDIVEVSLIDSTGVIVATFFRQPWLADQLQVGDSLALMGKLEFNYGFKRMTSPVFERLEKGTLQGDILPVHFVGEGLSVAWMRRIMSSAINDYADVDDYLPASIRAHRCLMSLGRAFREIHFPSSLTSANSARRRFAYDEVLLLNLALRLRTNEHILNIAATQHKSASCVARLYQALPFVLSDEQQRAVDEILHDMCDGKHVMSRMLLGDVGTGKTAVAAFALACVADSNTQAAVMAPTSVLAQQYAVKLGPVLDKIGVSWALLTGSTKPIDREKILSGLSSGNLTVVFGTNALLTSDVIFSHLTLAVIDEQHRFGVEQRTSLREKGENADLLVMTATPIPRSLALTIYGDLDTSIIRRRPIEGAGVHTKVLTQSNRDIAYTAIRQALLVGQQVYVVCPLVEPTDSCDELDDVPGIQRDDNGNELQPPHLHNVVEEAEKISREFPDVCVEILHGRMPGYKKDQIISDFRNHKIDILVSTTVIEVGVDVANATVMMVENAERFGLATLHQLRGRVGRGTIAGQCFLMTYAKRNGSKSAAHQRLEALTKTSDGFKLAQTDLRLRHEGEILGLRQSGGVALKFVDLETDLDIIAAARNDAIEMLRYSFDLSAPVLKPLRFELTQRYQTSFAEVSGG